VDATRRDVAPPSVGAPAPFAGGPLPGTLAGARYPVEIAGALGDVRFPPLCARCAAPPAGALALTKMFRRTHSDSPTTYVFGAVAVPFCHDCLDAHARERVPPDPRTLRALRNRFLLRTLPYVIPVVVIVYLLGQFGGTALRHLARGDMAGALMFCVPVAFFGLMFLMFARLVLRAREQLIAAYDGDPNAQYVEIVRGPLGTTCVLPGPPTATLAAVDFDDEEFQLFEANRRTFTFAHPAVGEQFAAANAGLVWHPDSPAARRATALRHAGLVLLGVAAALAAVYYYFGG
jgi:hypothetical protein